MTSMQMFGNNAPFMTILDQLAASTLHTLAIKREANDSPSAPSWSDTVPKGLQYPFYDIRVPEYSDNEEAKIVTEKIKHKGNTYFRLGYFYEAIWKYEHALIVARQIDVLKHTAALLHSNIAAACIKLGNERRVDLLDNQKFPPSIIMWYVFGQQHAGECVSMKPPNNILSKAHYRRGECFRVILRMPDLQNTIESMATSLSAPPTSATKESFVQVIVDFVKCIELQPIPDPKIFVEIILICVDYDHLRLIPPLTEHHVELKMPTNILLEMIKRPDAELKHVSYLLLDQDIRSHVEPHFDASSVSAVDLIKKKLADLPVLKKLHQCGMVVRKDEFASLRRMHKSKGIGSSVFDFLAAKQEESPEEVFIKLKAEGNALFSQGLYEQALGIYYKALNYCKKHKLNEEMAVIRSNCAQACLNLQLYSDAYSHADQCIKLDPQSYKGYFRRADALKGMLRCPQKSSPSPGTYRHVVKDYLESHRLKTNVDAFCNAVILTIDEKIDRSVIPFLTRAEISNGHSNNVLQKMFSLDTVDEHLIYTIFDWPCGLVEPFHCKQIKIEEVCKRSRNPFVYKKLFDLHMKATEEDLAVVVELLPAHCGDCMEVVANHVCVNLENRAKHILINKSCSHAMDIEKPDLAIALLKNGALPSKSEVKACRGMRGDPVVEAYLRGEGLVGPDVSSLSPHEAIVTLNRVADEWIDEEKYPQATQLYRRAMRIAQDNDLTKDEVMSRSNLSSLFSMQGYHYDSYMELCEVLKLDKNDADCLVRRGECLKLCLDNSDKVVTHETALKYGGAINDICRGNLLDPHPKSFATAMIMAVLYNQYHELRLYTDTIRDLDDFRDTCALELVYHKQCNPKILRFALCKFWAKDKIDLHRVSLLHMLKEVGVRELEIVQRFVECGMKVSELDMSYAIKLLDENNREHLQIFKLVTTKCPESELDNVCAKALNADKIPFVFCLIEHGAKCPGGNTKVLTCALKTEDNVLLINVIQSLKPEVIEKIDLGEIIHNLQIKSPAMVKTLIRYGVNPNGRGSKLPLVVVMSMEVLSVDRRCYIACTLLNGGADCNHLCKLRKGTTTPLHVATDYCLLTDGDPSLIKAVLDSPSFNVHAKKLLNDKQETPLHLAAKPNRKRDTSAVVLQALLEPGIIDPGRKDKSGKRALDLLPKSDSRYKLLDDAIKSFKPTGASSKKKKKKKSKQAAAKVEPVAEIDAVKEESPQEETPAEPTPQVVPEVPKPKPKAEFDYNKLSTIPERFNWLLGQLLLKNREYFTAVEEVVATHSDHEIDAAQHSDDEPSSRHPDSNHRQTPDLTVGVPREAPASREKVVAVAKNVASKRKTDMQNLFSKLGFELDSLPWEVEATDKVVRFFKNRKRYSHTDLECAARVIFKLAEGRRTHHLAKPVSSVPGLSLYEARITQAGRMLWEKAITFSPRLTNLNSQTTYTQVIRIWEVVLDHDALERRIKYCTEQIECSHERGKQSHVTWSLKPREVTSSGVQNKEKLEYPRIFLPPGAKCEVNEYQFVPAASTKQNEYNITTFFSFDTISFKSILTGTNERRDYPFKEWQKEHEIISLCSKAVILLLGRSGTGKTTCCLYKLWNEFKEFWNPLSHKYKCKLPRRVLVTPALQNPVECKHYSDSDLESSESPSDTDPTDMVSSKYHCDVTANLEQTEEDLQQVFVTKNYVLCDQIKRRFYNMAAAHDFLGEHMEFENKSLPTNFSEIDNFSYPLFLTARQFYILLDNSLGDNQSFFRRDPDGNVNVKISSTDYEHEDIDILLDFDESDSETETGTATSHPEQQVGKQHAEKWTEVTSLYFKEIVWPVISHQCHVSDKDYDPMLVWIEIQSFIKGSERSLRKGEHLTASEYFELGNKMAPHFSSVREVIFELFLKYQLYMQRLRHKEFLFDECDLMHNLFKRRQQVRDVPWSFHGIYIDEVQDFTQAELTVLIHCCRDPNSMFFTGDTAQSIMRGVAFRFQDLRTLYHSINQQAPFVHVPQKPHALAINFRSHSGILKLAGSVIDLISEFFKDSIDYLPDDEGMFPGPTPVLVESCQIDELALLLSASRRKSSAIEFGAHQAIIVQSKQSKDKLPDILKGAIVLTVFEAKGLEFDDVLLYNFFSDSAVDEKGWRVISSYLEMAKHQGKIINKSKLPGSSVEPRIKHFDPKLHKSLNSELKYLYTAITRTKCNLWIYDSNEKMRLPMFSYWHKRELVKVVQSGTATSSTEAASRNFLDIVFAARHSSTQQWKIQGDNFWRKHLWEQAKLCYERSGKENLYLVKQAHGYQLIQSARQQKPSLYLEAAVLFLESDRLHHSPRCIYTAALCLRHAKPAKLTQAGKLYERLEEYGKASQAYLRAKDFENFSQLKEKMGEYESVVRTLLGKPFMRKRDALMKAREYDQNGIELPEELSASKLAYSCAKFYSERKDHATLIDVLQYMPETDRKIRFLKEAKLFKEAFDECVKHRLYGDAFRLASAQGFYTSGLTLACKQKDKAQENSFILLSAKCKYLRVLEKKSKSKEKVTPKEALEIMTEPVIVDLEELVTRGKQHNSIALSICASLLLGMVKQDPGLCRHAVQGFKKLGHKIGVVEAFNCLQELNDEPTRSVLEVCQIAKEVAVTFERAKDINNDIQNGLKFYHFRKIGNVYCTPRDQDIWITGLVRNCSAEVDSIDIDGMYRLDSRKVCLQVSQHCLEYIDTWVAKSKLESTLAENRKTFPLIRDVISVTKFPLERVYDNEEVSSESLRLFIQSSLQFIHARLVQGKDAEEAINSIITVFSPHIAWYLPTRYTEFQVDLVRKYTQTHPGFRKWITKLLGPAKELPDKVNLDVWLNTWRACCLMAPDMKPLTTVLDELKSTVTKKAERKDYTIPCGFLRQDKAYSHIFCMWLFSCTDLRNGKTLAASKRVINHFITEVATDQAIKLSVMNSVNILSFHCTTLLVILRHIQNRQNTMSLLTVPMMYKSTIQLFDYMLSFKDKKCKTLSACTQEIGNMSDQDLPNIFKESRRLLFRVLDILVGLFKNNPRYSVLGFAMRKMADEDITRHCAILTFTVFGNLMMLGYKDVIMKHRDKIFETLTRILRSQQPVPSYLEYVVTYIASPYFLVPRGVFALVDYLLRLKNQKQSLARIMLKSSGKIDFNPLERQQLPQLYGQGNVGSDGGEQRATNQPSTQTKPQVPTGAAKLPFTATKVSEQPPSSIQYQDPTPSGTGVQQETQQTPVRQVLQQVTQPTPGSRQQQYADTEPQQISRGDPQLSLGSGVDKSIGMGLQQAFGMGVQQPTGIGVQQPTGMGVQQPTGMGVQQPTGMGVQQPTGMGVQQPTGMGIQQPTGMGVQQPTGMGVQPIVTGSQQPFGTRLPQQHYGTSMHYPGFIPQPRIGEYPYPEYFPSTQHGHNTPDWQGLFLYPGMQAPSTPPNYTPQYPTDPTTVTVGRTFPTTQPAKPQTSAPADVEAHVVASYSNEQLRQLATAKTPDFKTEYDSSEMLTEEDLAELDEELGVDEEFEPAPSSTSAPIVPAIDPELIDPSIITAENCDACGESFASPESSEDYPLYYSHVMSEAHQTNALLFKRFFFLLDSEDNQRSYFQMTVKVRDLAERCRQVKEFSEMERMDKLIDFIKESVEQNDKNLALVQERLQWRKGIEDIQKMVEVMDSQLYTGESLYNKALLEGNKISSDLIHEDLEMELDMMLSQPAVVDEQPAPVVKKLRSVEQKHESRQRKRTRREQGRGGNRK